MFKKKKCPRCKKKIGESYSFCPHCGNRFDSEDDGEWGMLGKNDFISPMNEIKLPVGFNALFNSIMRNLSKELDGQLSRDLFHNKPKKIKKDGISISISTFGDSPPKIKVTQFDDKQQKIKETEKVKSNIFTKEKIKEFSELQKEEPETKIRRLSNKVVYEIKIPGVKSKEDISIMKLENSIEIKAIAKNKAYKKIIPISLPIKNYNLSDGKLTLELGIKN